MSSLSGVFIGGRSLLISCAERFVRRGHALRAVVSSDPAVQRWAGEHRILCLEPGHDVAPRLAAGAFDYLFSVAHLEVIPPDVLALPCTGAINFHDGPLPDYAGLNAPSWALLNGEREHGVTWHLMTREVDAGDVVAAARFPIAGDETALTLNARCYEAAVATFEELLSDLAGGSLRPVRQDLERRRYYGRHRRPGLAGSIDASRPAEEVAALVRALDFGPYPNPLTTAKVWVGETPLVVRRIEVLPTRSTHAPGTVIAAAPDGVTVSTGTRDVVWRELATVLGSPLSAADLERTHGVRVGTVLPPLDGERARALCALDAAACRHERFWLPRLRLLEPIEMPFVRRDAGGASRCASSRVAVPQLFAERFPRAPGDALLAALCAYFWRIGGKAPFTVPLRHPGLALGGPDLGLFSPHVPLRVAPDPDADFAACSQALLEQLASLRQHATYALDLAQREPAIGDAMRRWHGERPPLVLERAPSTSDGASSPVEAELTVVVPDDGRGLAWRYREAALDARTVARMQRQFAAFLADLLETPRSVSRLTLLPREEADQLATWNATELDHERGRCVHGLLEAQARRTPDATALVCGDEELTYRELDARANAVAHDLVARGVGPGALVGVLMERSLEMVVGTIAVLKAGGAYVPLDPAYPRERLAFMIEDARLTAIVTRGAGALPVVPPPSVPVIALERSPERAPRRPDGPVTTVAASDPAYVIYTSGSTGKPKGVIVEHRNVVAFFAAMDAQLGRERDGQGTWLAVTSTSFDISVLELFWTLARGFKVVIAAPDDEASDAEPGRGAGEAARPVAFSLFYFASDEGERAREKYSLLLEGARFADGHGFEAVWTPERHFHAFGGLYPNPAVASAAIAAVTERVQIRAGSCVLPLHSPIRIAEDWSLVDCLSNGRAGISFASGWQPDDFVLAPDGYDDRHRTFFEGIEAVRALWRGEGRTFRGPRGEVEVRTLPRPVQRELPFWVTAAGNPETFRQAGRSGANLLTHLLGQSVDELGEKIELYRRARRDAGHDGPGQVTLMLHAFVAPDEAFARSQVRGPLKEYLRSATQLLKQHASSFPAFRGVRGDGIDQRFAELSADDLDALLEHAFERYYETSGLLGTPESCLRTVERLQALGVNEIACLIDFGVPSDVVLAHLPYLDEVRRRAGRRSEEGPVGSDVGALLERHRVTHLQCTPSLATTLVRNRRAAAQLGHLADLMVGGEPFPPELARQLLSLGPARITNMYGPTETTIWSATHAVTDATTSIPIGRPIANTQLHVVDDALELVPPGVAGELLIGGEGVARGYLNRPELTAERFIADPFRPGGRLYRTGDRVRWREDGVLEFLGRIDNQVKIRGHRVELGEIEAVLGRHPGVRQAVVAAREDVPGERRLVGYVVFEPGAAPLGSELREFLARELPDFMVPAAFVSLQAFPLTPNRKIDRKSLPAPDQSRPALETAFVAPRTRGEATLAAFFQEVLGLDEVGVLDRFTDLGGDSLSAVELLVRIEQAFEVELPLSTFFRAPSIAALGEEIERARATPRGRGAERVSTA